MYLLNLSLTSTHVPTDFKVARVTPLYKGTGSIDDSENYRPISVVCHVSKILEKAVCAQLMNYLELHAFITPDQSAFLTNHSLHRLTDDLLKNMDANLVTFLCFFDIRKCYDSISHPIFLGKLEKYGIISHEQRWFQSY